MKKLFIILILTQVFLVQCKEQLNLPKIYGVMITGKDNYHYSLALKSIKSFLEQTYSNKHLIIVNDGSYNFKNFDKNKVTEIRVKKQVLGALRNVAINYLKENDLWIQWDDDDWRHPQLIEEQYNFLKLNNLDACILQNQVQYAFKLNKAKVVKRKGIGGTILCKNKKNIRYPLQATREDTIFLKSYMQRYKLKAWNNAPIYYIRFIHQHNTWDISHFKLNTFKDISSLNLDKNYLKEIISLYKK